MARDEQPKGKGNITMKTSVLILALVLCAEMVRAADACKSSAKATQRSCLAGAKSDYALALGKCANLADPAAQKACQDQAKVDLKDALGECTDQFDARLAVCDRLGTA